MRRKFLIGSAIAASPLVVRWLRPRLARLRGGAAADGEAERVKEQMTAPLPESERSGAAPTAQAFVEPEQRD